MEYFKPDTAGLASVFKFGVKTFPATGKLNLVLWVLQPEFNLW